MARHLTNLRLQLKLPFSFSFLVTVGALSATAAPALPPPQMTFLDNGEVRVGMDLALGGAVTFISSKDHPGNIINSADLGADPDVPLLWPVAF